MALQYNLAQLLKADVGDVRAFGFRSDDPIDLEDAVASAIDGRVKFTLTNFGILAAVHAGAVLHLNCARCLEPFQMPVEVDFEEEYRPSIDIVTGLPAESPQSDTAFFISQNHTVDLSEALRQHLVLAVELIPVCRPDCQGLCPECGANRNLEPCACTPVERHSPFAVLQTLLAESNAEHSSSKET